MPESKPTTPPRGLTPKFIEALRPLTVAYDVPDRRAPGLVVRVLPATEKRLANPRRVFRWYCTARKRVITIGPWTMNPQPGHVTLGEARDWLEKLKSAHAADALAAVEADLAVQLRTRALVAAPAAEDPNRRTFKSTAEAFFAEDIGVNRKHPEDVRAMLDHDLLPALGHKILDEITTLDCRDVIRRIVTGRDRPNGRAAPVHAGKVLSTLKQFFNWAQANGFTDRNPAFPLKARHLGVEVNASDRWLDADEIRLVWDALDRALQADRPAHRRLRPATAAAIRILLLTAVRTGELLRARWDDVNLDTATWTIPVANQKLTKAQERKAKPFIIPLTPLAVEQFTVLKASAGSSPWVMASTEADSGHYEGKSFGHAVRRMQAGAHPLLALPGGEMTPHDLRRTARTHLAKLKVPHWIVERCLNHSLGKIAATYDQHDYFEERRDALLLWDARVRNLVAPEKTNVAFLAAAGTR